MLTDIFSCKPWKTAYYPDLKEEYLPASWNNGTSAGANAEKSARGPNAQRGFSTLKLRRLSFTSSMWQTLRTKGGVALLTMLACTAAYSSENFDTPLKLLASTHLIEVTSGTELSKLAAAYRSASFESSGGKLVTFDKWYSTRLSDTRLTWMTQMTPDFGLIWGMSTGERGEKYAIAPSVKLGFVYQTKVSRASTFSIRATSLIGGRIKEKPCTANYGDIGGVQQVNCRLAASNLQPEETLRYLIDTLPRNRNSIFINYTTFF